jgi:hypothetical protein
MKPKSKPIKSVVKRRKEARLVKRPAKLRMRRELSQLRALYAAKGA